MSPTTEQIALMAKLVPEHVDFEDGHHWIDQRTVAGIYPRWWEPWAQTEAGRSDWAFLFAAVEKYAASQPYADGHGSAWYDPINTAVESGDLTAIQRATCEAAEAIGRTLS